MAELSQQDVESKRNRIAKIVKIAGVVVFAFIVAPFVWIAIGGLVGLIVAGVVAVIGVNILPWLSMKAANWRIKLIVGEAEANPIETMQNIDIERTKELNEKDKYLEDWDTEVANFDDELVGIKKDYPEEAPRYEAMSASMHAYLNEARQEQESARQELFEFEKAIKKAKSLYKIALAAQKVESFSKRDEAKVLQDIKTQVAFDSVRSNLNRSFARLNTAMNRRGERPALTPTAMPAHLGQGTPNTVPTFAHGDSRPKVSVVPQQALPPSEKEGSGQ